MASKDAGVAAPPTPPVAITAASASSSTPAPLKLMIVTWNVGNTKPTAEGVEAILPTGEFEAMDVIVVGNQECKYKGDGQPEKGGAKGAGLASMPTAAKHAGGATRRMSAPSAASIELAAKIPHHYTHLLQDHLGPDFALIGHENLMEMRIAVFVRVGEDRALEAELRRTVETARSATGLLFGTVGNKGGLVVTLKLRGTSLVFVSCHLAAHLKEYKTRNANCKEILREALVGNKLVDAVSQYDHCFWLGDLNYRVDVDGASDTGDGAETPKEDRHALVSGLVQEEKWSELMAMDQLRRAQRDGAALVGFEEGDPHFAPTFKVEQGLPITKFQSKRIPSYCDRILWRSMPHLQGKVRLINLNSVPAVTTSDHKPVRAIVEVDVSPQVERVSEDDFDSVCPVVSFSGLRARGLFNADGAGDLSDPYVIFFTDPPGLLCPPGAKQEKDAPRTVTKMDDLNPQWADKEVPCLRPRVRTPAELGNCSLIMAIYDKDRLNADDLLGIATLRFPLSTTSRESADSADEEHHWAELAFSEQLLLNGSVFGSIEGKVCVDWSEKGKAEKHEVEPGKDGCCALS